MVITHDGVVQKNQNNLKCAMKVKEDLIEDRIGEN